MPALLASAIAIGGCGEGGASAGAIVSVYVGAPLCRPARQQLAREPSSLGGLRVQVACLAPVKTAGRIDLAQAGADARRATEDSTAVAFLEAPSPAARFSRSLVESAEIAWIETDSGAEGMRRVLAALEGRGPSSPRSAVLDQVG